MVKDLDLASALSILKDYVGINNIQYIVESLCSLDLRHMTLGHLFYPSPYLFQLWQWHIAVKYWHLLV